ncbi:hypothetical protein EDF74_3225 [Stenotrophomonas rhizophila]|nr:hypothetical protein EDF74_3225 [Stenotrophomonas rhizophila]
MPFPAGISDWLVEAECSERLDQVDTGLAARGQFNEDVVHDATFLHFFLGSVLDQLGGSADQLRNELQLPGLRRQRFVFALAMSVFATLHGCFSCHCVCIAACTDSRPDCACRYVPSVPSVGDASCYGIAAPVRGKCNILSIFIGEQPINGVCAPAVSRSCVQVARHRIATRLMGEGSGPIRRDRTLAKCRVGVADVPNASHPFQSDVKVLIKAFPLAG